MSQEKLLFTRLLRHIIITHMNIMRYVFCSIVCIFFYNLGLLAIPILKDEEKPIFQIDTAPITYQITKRGSNYWLQRIDGSKPTHAPISGFKGAAIRISGADFSLDQYLEQDVYVAGIFASAPGGHSYHLTSVQKFCSQ